MQQLLRKPSLWILIFMTSVGPFGDTEYTPSLPHMAKTLQTSYTSVQQTMTVYLAAYAFMQLFYGPLSDRFGRKPIVLVGAVLFTLGSFICYVSFSLDLLLFGRFLQGLGACAGAIISAAAVRDSFPKEKIDNVYAKINAAFALAPAAGPIVGAFVADRYSWHANMLILFVLGILLIAAVALFFPETHLPDRTRRLYVTDLFWTYRTLFRQKQFLPALLINAVAIGAVYISLTEGPALVTETFGRSPKWFALVALLVLTAFSLGSLLSIWLKRSLHAQAIISWGLLCIFAGGMWLGALWLIHIFSWFTVMPAIMLAYVGIALVVPNAMAVAMRPFTTIAGAASAIVGFVQMAIASLANAGASLLPNGPVYALGVAFGILGLLGIAVFRLGFGKGGWKA